MRYGINKTDIILWGLELFTIHEIPENLKINFEGKNIENVYYWLGKQWATLCKSSRFLQYDTRYVFLCWNFNQLYDEITWWQSSS